MMNLGLLVVMVTMVVRLIYGSSSVNVTPKGKGSILEMTVSVMFLVSITYRGKGTKSLK